MISDEKKEEIRDAADIVEVVGEYVKLKRSGSGFTGLCPYHNEKTPSFHVTPRLGIFKCFGCGETGDVFKFVMDQEGIGFTEAVKMLADKYGIFVPEEEKSEEYTEQQHQREGILHALKYAGVFYYRNLVENPEAEKALLYLEKRGYNQEAFKRFGLGYAPQTGDALYSSAIDAGISEEYLLEADLIKPSQRGDGYYDTYRGRLMFPIFNPSGKAIAFAGRVLGNEKTAKYINSSQTKVYNKSEVVYGLNFAKNEIRKQGEVILVEGYTDVITLNLHGISNVVASSGTALTAGQMKVLHRYGERIIMIYDSDSAGQAAMKRGIDIALAEGMEVKLLELPEGEDPDSFVKQFGKDSFVELRKEEAVDFVSFLIHKAELDGLLDDPMQRTRTIGDVLRAIAHIPDEINRQVFVQHLHQKTQQFRKGSDRELFEELDRILAEKKQEERRSERREEFRQQREQNEIPPVEDEFEGLPTGQSSNKKKPHYEKEIIRLMIEYGNGVVKFIGSICNAQLFEDEELKSFFDVIIQDFKDEKDISAKHYANSQPPFPRLVSEVSLEQHSASDRHHEKTGLKYEKDKDPYATAKSTMKTLQLNFSKKLRDEIADRLMTAQGDERATLVEQQTHIRAQINKMENTPFEELYSDPPERSKEKRQDVFEYKMKTDND